MRYGDAVLDAVSAAIDQIKNDTAANVLLVGFSGGGTIATLLAARRSDIAAVITVAANLDTRYWTDLHGVTPLTGSANPAALGAALRHIPQLHYTGAQDRVVPSAVVRSYLAAAGLPAQDHLVVVPGFDHHCCWAERWPQLLQAALDTLKIDPALTREK